MHTNVQSLAESGKRPPNSLRILVPREVRSTILGDVAPKPNSRTPQDDSSLLEVPTKRWPLTVAIQSNPLLPRKEVHRRFLVPWFKTFKDDVHRICSTTNFGWRLRVLLIGRRFVEGFIEFTRKIYGLSGVLITDSSYQSTFMVFGLSPDIDEVDKREFEGKLGVEILFFSKIGQISEYDPESDCDRQCREQGHVDFGEVLFQFYVLNAVGLENIVQTVMATAIGHIERNVTRSKNTSPGHKFKAVRMLHHPSQGL
ncbi:hypothetical protein ACOME3_001120 [Neoechinorhynchus agilis]